MGENAVGHGTLPASFQDTSRITPKSIGILVIVGATRRSGDRYPLGPARELDDEVRALDPDRADGIVRLYREEAWNQGRPERFPPGGPASKDHRADQRCTQRVGQIRSRLRPEDSAGKPWYGRRPGDT